MKKKKRTRLKIKAIIISVFIVLIIALAFCIKDILDVLKTGTSEVAILDTIEEYNYSLNQYDSEYYKELFEDLKKELTKKEIDEKKYASLLSMIFVTDFFSLDSSINKNDVGGIQFIYESYQEDFIKRSKDTIYKYVENNIYGKRTQELPIVSLVEVSSIEQDSVEFENDVNDEEAYIVELEITYKKDLEYSKNVTLTIVHSGNKLEIAKME